MLGILKKIYSFLPVQLLLLHFRKYHLLLGFWLLLATAITGQFAASFGASSLFLAPEYYGRISFFSMFLLGSATAVFIMAWNITTFIIHSHRIPFLGAIRQAFLQYCLNNSLIPLAFLVFYSVMSIRYQYYNEHLPLTDVLLLQLGFYLGFVVLLLFSFLYFFRVDRNLLKLVIATITNPARIRGIIPYDTLDVEFDMIRADTFLSWNFRLEKISELEGYHPRLLGVVLRRHHRNAVTATFFALIILFVSGIFVDTPALRVPAGSSFLILFAVLAGLVGALKYFLKTWEFMGWVLVILLLSFLVKKEIVDFRSIAYGLDYNKDKQALPVYNYQSLDRLFTPERYLADKRQEEGRLANWKALMPATTAQKPPLVILAVSGGGSRAAYWTFRSLQYLDSLSGGKLFTHTVLFTGASGGMIGASYWRAIHAGSEQFNNPYQMRYQENMGKDLLNAIIFSLTSVDLISPFNKTSIAGYAYTKDRGYAFEQELIHNTGGLLDQTIGDYREAEAAGTIPAMILNSTIVNDGRRLMVAAQPVSYLCRPAYAYRDSFPSLVDAVDFAGFFAGQDPYNLRLTTALRMNASFPYVLPVVRLPSRPEINVMDAGLRDNFGMEVVMRYLHTHLAWMQKHAGNIIILEIRDTQPHEVFTPREQTSLSSMIVDPLFAVQQQWEPFQTYAQTYMKEFALSLSDKVSFISLNYIPNTKEESAALNFHLTRRERQDLYQAVSHPQNQAAIKRFLQLLHQ